MTELTRQIRNARRRLRTLQRRRDEGPEIREAGPLAMEFVDYLNGEIKRLKNHISALEEERAREKASG